MLKIKIKCFAIFCLFASLSVLFCSSCGVKGKPQSPTTPPYIGKGLKGIK